MNAKELKDFQDSMDDKIYSHAKEKGLISSEIEPICDGVCDIETYVRSTPRIMWILKEPYDDNGGGFSIPGELDDALKDPTYKLTITQKKIIYVMEGIRNGETYDDMHWYYEPEMLEHLRNIAYINLSKMPGLSYSGDMTEKYNLWKDIVQEQIEVYDPEVIICGGTAKWLDPDYDEQVYIDTENAGQFGCYKLGNRLIIDVYHPACRISYSEYVNSISALVNRNIKSL